jgi:hypothetical protein
MLCAVLAAFRLCYRVPPSMVAQGRGQDLPRFGEKSEFSKERGLRTADWMVLVK